MEIRAENLYSGSMKAPFGHIKWIESGSHYTSEKLRLPFHTSEGSQGAIHNMGLQDMIELGRSPGGFLCKLNSAGLEKVDVEAHTTT